MKGGTKMKKDLLDEGSTMAMARRQKEMYSLFKELRQKRWILGFSAETVHETTLQMHLRFQGR